MRADGRQDVARKHHSNHKSPQSPASRRPEARQPSRQARQRQRRARPCSPQRLCPADTGEQILATRRAGAGPQVTAPKAKPGLGRPRCMTAIGATDAFSQSPLPRPSRPFIEAILEARSGSNPGALVADPEGPSVRRHPLAQRAAAAVAGVEPRGTRCTGCGERVRTRAAIAAHAPALGKQRGGADLDRREGRRPGARARRRHARRARGGRAQHGDGSARRGARAMLPPSSSTILTILSAVRGPGLFAFMCSHTTGPDAVLFFME